MLYKSSPKQLFSELKIANVILSADKNIWGHLVEFVLVCIKGLEKNSKTFLSLHKDIQQFQN